MKLAVFDIDGTLTRTNQIDALCFARAFEEGPATSMVEVRRLVAPEMLVEIEAEAVVAEE